jgi:hypothetical protein
MQQKGGHVAVTPIFTSGSEGEAGRKVYGVAIRLFKLGSGGAFTTQGNRNEGEPTATTCKRGAGRPSRTNVGLADRVGELNIGALAGHAWDFPAAPAATFSIAAATEGFSLKFGECFEFDHLFREMSVMGMAQPVSTGVLSNWLFFSSNAATRTFHYFLFAKFYFSQSSSCGLLHRLCCLSVYLFFRPLDFRFFQRRFLAFRS